ncbi:unnamed protein product [Paramecium pentaurelia]|uniref:Uncharacterized protein n=1 Tax=Paramecium pentaurelia TaxID=43138 RepID=A0A8S1T2I6_9CILI|nr:unnamed protein product [Paramecium pentaurelia]
MAIQLKTLTVRLQGPALTECCIKKVTTKAPWKSALIHKCTIVETNQGWRGEEQSELKTKLNPEFDSFNVITLFFIQFKDNLTLLLSKLMLFKQF